YRGSMFYAVNTAAQALSVASSTYTGLVVQNPVSSSKNLAILEVIFIPTIAETGVGAIILGWGTAQTAGVPLALTTGNSSGPKGLPTLVGSNFGSSAGVGASCTWSVSGGSAAPTYLRPMVSMQYGTAVGLNMMAYKDEIAGALIIAPGYQVGIQAITTAITGIGYISWEEIGL